MKMVPQSFIASAFKFHFFDDKFLFNWMKLLAAYQLILENIKAVSKYSMV